MIKYSGNTINDWNLGTSNISKMYFNGAVCFEKMANNVTPPTPPAFQGKWKATYSDSSVSSAQCGANSAITQSEISLSNLVDVVMGDCVRTIEHDAFIYCTSLTSCTIGNNVTFIGAYAFNGCRSLTSITIPNSVTTIADYAFPNCSGLSSIDIPSSVTNIGTQVFQACSSLTSVTIGSGVTSIGSSAFRNCSSLTSVTCLATTPPTLGWMAFNDTNNCPIYVPAASVSAYQSAWSTYASRITAIPNS